MSAQRIVTCAWCSESVIRRQMHRHFSGDCAKGPSVSSEQKICTSCQEVRSIDDFPKRRAMKHGRDHTCIPCHKQRCRDWLAIHRPRKIPKNFRPGRWVLRPCPFCGQSFTARQMGVHQPRCPKHPPRVNGKGLKQVEESAHKAQFISLTEDVSEIQRNAPNELQRKHKTANLMFFYGLSLDEYERMLAAQNGVCAICGKPPLKTSVQNMSLHVDHDHAATDAAAGNGQMKIRGLLCNKCNVGLGSFYDNPAFLLSAISYLAVHQGLGIVT